MSLETLDSLVIHLQTNAIEKSTTRGYATGIRDYLHFCKIHNLPIDPTPRTLSRYIAFSSQYIRSAPKYLSGARHFLNQFYPEFDNNRSHPLVQATIRGSKKIRADSINRKHPLRISHLEYFHSRATISHSYDDLLFITIMACGFYNCHRLGELVIQNTSSLNVLKIIKRSSLCTSHNRASYHLPYHKTDPFSRGTSIILFPQDVANPVLLLTEYVIQRDRLHRERIALFLRQDGSHPTRSWFMQRLQASLGKDFGGHSMRAGGATFFASLGVTEDVIQAVGRWSSHAWKIYIRDNPSVRVELQLSRMRLQASQHHK